MLKIVTITGADDSINPAELFTISNKYPWVEWAILVSQGNEGRNRFPSNAWMNELIRLNKIRIVEESKPSLNLSLHLCGEYVRQILKGDDTFIEDHLDNIWQAFARVQINTHGEKHVIANNFTDVLSNYPDKEFIFQYDMVNTKMLEIAIRDGVKCSALFDLSHGAGKLPEQWPDLLPNVKCGYAGGLGPDNIESQIIAIEAKAGEEEIWIDMETKVRSHNDRCLDVVKVITVLETSKDYINQHGLKM